MPRSRHAFLHLLALTAFAVAQPLYDLIGRHAEFLVAHRAGPWTVAALAGALSVLIPLLLFSIVQAARLVSARAGAWLLTAIVAALSGLIAAGALRQARPAIAASIAVAIAVAAAVAYRARPIRAFLSVASVAALVFPLLFVTTTPVSRLVWPHRARQATTTAERHPPIVLVVFDELDTLSLLDAKGEIDAARYPNFAALARSSTWFPNAFAAFPYTNHALPAILTGVSADGSSKKLPIAADYPSNLFTWLAGSYLLHVGESFTALCPPSQCVAAAPPARLRAAALASDIAILYLHLVTPREIAETRLPPLAFAWKGFASPTKPLQPVAPPPTHDTDAAFKRALEIRRPELFREFVGEIQASDRPVLHFLHTLLPHDPYEYFASGRSYPHEGRVTGLGPQGWTDDPTLIEAARHRHVEQLRFVDALVGELIQRLETEGLFDPALLIVTSDHGGSFQPGQPHRALTTANYREMVAAPVFVKLPNQRTGSMDDRRVSGLDIVPTIAAAIGAEVPWRVDGTPMFADVFPERATLDYRGLSLPPLPAFDVREEARQRALASPPPSAIETQLIGRAVSELDAAPPVPGRYALSDSFRAFESVSLQSGSVPALVHGVVADDSPPSQPVDLAIAVNGIVRAVTRTAKWNNSPHFFSTLVPDAAFHDGANRLEVLAIERSGPGLRLSPVPSPLPTGLRIQAGPSGEQLVANGGMVAALRPHIGGTIDRVDETANSLILHGWAADTKTARDLRAVIAFSGGSAIAFAFPGGDRPDVIAALGLSRPAKTGFGLSIQRTDVRADGVRVFGLTLEDEAGELQPSVQARPLLRR